MNNRPYVVHFRDGRKSAVIYAGSAREAEILAQAERISAGQNYDVASVLEVK